MSFQYKDFERNKELADFTNNFKKFSTNDFPGLKSILKEIDQIKNKQLTDEIHGNYNTSTANHFNSKALTQNLEQGKAPFADIYRVAYKPKSLDYRDNRAAKLVNKPKNLDPFSNDWHTTNNQLFESKARWEAAKLTDGPIRTGTSSGPLGRSNKPHPELINQTFIDWKLKKYRHLDKMEETNDDPILKKVFKDQLTSTYDNDFLDNKESLRNIKLDEAKKLFQWANPHLVAEYNSYQRKMADKEKILKLSNENENSRENSYHKNWENEVSHDFKSTNQVMSSQSGIHRKLFEHKNFTGNKTRYGCNQKKMIATTGAVPTVIYSYMDNNNRGPKKTSYQSQFS